MARPKGSKNKPKPGMASQRHTTPERAFVVEITEDMILHHFTAGKLLQLASKQLARSENRVPRGEPSVSVQTDSDTNSAQKRKGRRRRHFSAEARAKMAEAQRRRWAKSRSKTK